MTFHYDDNIKAYMTQTGKRNIIVEVATCDGSDFEVSELHTHFVSDKDAEFFLTKKRFRSFETEMGRVLLPPYRLEYDEEIFFTLKKILFIPMIKQTGIRL